jgi:hypothetical protein
MVATNDAWGTNFRTVSPYFSIGVGLSTTMLGHNPDGFSIVVTEEYRGMGSMTSLARLYLGLAVIGFLVPNTVTLIESVQTGNILFWADPARTTSELFANRTSTAFALDLFATAIAALIWMTQEARRVGITRVWRFWVLTLLFGLGGILPLFLYLRERRLATRQD